MPCHRCKNVFFKRGFHVKEIAYFLYAIHFFPITALHKAGKHMENSIVAAYIALLVGCLIQENQVCLLESVQKFKKKGQKTVLLIYFSIIRDGEI